MTAYRGRCVYCGKFLLKDFDTFWSTQEDHLYTRSARGALAEYLLPACFVCNNLRGNYLPRGAERMTSEQLIAKIRTYVMGQRKKKCDSDFATWSKEKRLWACNSTPRSTTALRASARRAGKRVR